MQWTIGACVCWVFALLIGDPMGEIVLIFAGLGFILVGSAKNERDW